MKSRYSTLRLAVAGLMTAVVFASNYAQIILPIAIGGTPRFTLANIACALSGLLLGPIGGLAAGLGSALYDLTFPAYAPECWITFLTKGSLGLVVGLVVWHGRQADTASPLPYPKALVATVLGCVTYYALFFAKSIFYNGMLVEGLPFAAALAILPLKAWVSVFNATVAIAIAPPLCMAVRTALKKSGLRLA